MSSDESDHPLNHRLAGLGHQHFDHTADAHEERSRTDIRLNRNFDPDALNSVEQIVAISLAIIFLVGIIAVIIFVLFYN